MGSGTSLAAPSSAEASERALLGRKATSLERDQATPLQVDLGLLLLYARKTMLGC
jgi:hypothetical protein